MRFLFFFWMKQPPAAMDRGALIVLGFFALIGAIGVAIMWIGYASWFLSWLFGC